jgi:WXG100 family type VII secretion target
VSKQRLDPATLEQIASKFEHNRTLINEQFKVITDAVERTRPAWGGSAGTGFQSVHQMWGEQQDRILRLLAETAQSVRGTATVAGVATQEAEQQIKASIGDLPL